jgi:hypothetical protein
MNYTRRGNKWTVNEILSLQREYELLEMDIQEIALKHGRSVQAILYKLDKEEFINTWYDARGYNNYSNKNDEQDDEGEYVYGDDQYVSDDEDYIETQDASDDDSYDVSDDEQDVSDDDESDDDDEMVTLTRRVGYIENSVNEIKNLITNLLKSINNNISITSSLEA